MTMLVSAGAVLLLAACGAASDADSTADVATSQYAPTAAPSGLAPLESAEGTLVALDDVGTVRVPDGATKDTASSTTQMVYRMPDAGPEGFPALQVALEPGATVGVYEQTWTAQNETLLKPAITDYTRSAVTWPGSSESVVITWTEDIAMADGSTFTIDGLDLLVDAANGTLVRVSAYAPTGELDGSAVLESLRTLTLS